MSPAPGVAVPIVVIVVIGHRYLRHRRRCCARGRVAARLDSNRDDDFIRNDDIVRNNVPLAKWRAQSRDGEQSTTEDSETHFVVDILD